MEILCRFGKKPLKIGVRRGVAAAEGRRFRKKRAVFKDQLMPAENKVGGRFPFARCAVDVNLELTRRKGGKEGFTVFRLADDLVRGGKIQHHGSAPQGGFGGGRRRDPAVLADLDGDRQRRHSLAAEELARAEGAFLPSGSRTVTQPPAGAGVNQRRS